MRDLDADTHNYPSLIVAGRASDHRSLDVQQTHFLWGAQENSDMSHLFVSETPKAMSTSQIDHTRELLLNRTNRIEPAHYEEVSDSGIRVILYVHEGNGVNPNSLCCVLLGLKNVFFYSGLHSGEQMAVTSACSYNRMVCTQ